MKTIAIIPNVSKDKELLVTKSVINYIKNECTVLLPRKLAGKISGCTFLESAELFRQAQIVIVLGGDGTILGAAKWCAMAGIPILGINLGHLGFMAEIEKDCFAQNLQHLLRDEYKIEKRMMLDISVYKKGRRTNRFLGLNDGVITCGPGNSRIITLSEYIDDELVDTFPADGVIVATPTGSTAYSLSAGGPIASPDMEMMLLTPICAHTIHSRPLVVAKNKRVKVVIERTGDGGANLTVDGQTSCVLEKGDAVVVKKARHYTKLIKLSENSFYKTLRFKLSGRD